MKQAELKRILLFHVDHNREVVGVGLAEDDCKQLFNQINKEMDQIVAVLKEAT